MNWFSRNAATIEAAASVVTACAAVAALIGVTYQLDATDKITRAQSARDTYRAHLAFAATQPDFARPQQACDLLASDQGGAYEAFVDHLLYSAEQMLALDPEWDVTYLEALSPHRSYLCSDGAPFGDTSETAALLTQFRAAECTHDITC